MFNNRKTKKLLPQSKVWQFLSFISFIRIIKLTTTSQINITIFIFLDVLNIFSYISIFCLSIDYLI